MTTVKSQDQWAAEEREKAEELRKPNETDNDGWIICGHDIEQAFLRIKHLHKDINPKEWAWAKEFIYMVDRMQGRTTINVPAVKVYENSRLCLRFASDFGRSDLHVGIILKEDAIAEEGSSL